MTYLDPRGTGAPAVPDEIFWGEEPFWKIHGSARGTGEKVYGVRINVAPWISKLNLILVQLVLLLGREGQILLYLKSMASSQFAPFFFIAVMNLIYEKLDLIDLRYKDVW
jgi:hypothetical protein